MIFFLNPMLTSHQNMSDKHINIYIHTIIKTLKEEKTPLTFDQIRQKTKIDLLSNSLLLQSLRKNDKIVCDNNTLSYQYTYSISSTDDIRKIFKSQEFHQGIELERLSDTRENISEFVSELVANKEIIVLKDNDNSEIVFYDDYPVEGAQDEVKKLWHAVKVPVYQDLILRLNSAGLKKDKTENVHRRIVQKKAKKKRNQRRIKITNTHVKDLDLSQMNDYD